MIILQNGEQLIRKDGAELFSDEKKFGKGTLYLTNIRMMFETENGMVQRLIVLHSIQSVVPVKKHEFTVSYMNDDSTGIFTDRYKIMDGEKCEDWIEDFRNICNTSMLSGANSVYSKSTTEGRENRIESLQDDRQNVNDVVVDVNSKTLSWKKIEGWRKFPDEHIWQGTKRLDSMTNEEWHAFKQESFALDDRLFKLKHEYLNAKKRGDKQRCAEIGEEMQIINLELTGRKVIPFKSITREQFSE
ncbi:hypothetical protein Ngar_c19900 [Candidatus Nitrososphaera gargensis Ga9.2]|uniref:GRAM domain-containing protein n=1 Tax=Nitrososphaera gargensis (strain Ga9.2) TaxID=1237085 RepID=K0IKG8_NITGG|nr:hypothetical protein [Candidatus Nitrososphaera gargensis]AFU58922.1 hypothetical protein Ngar_c19900 [Candidatus Nitrososphaera gargensis Ga9.2]